MKKLSIFIALLSLILVLCLCSCNRTPTEGLKYKLLSDNTYEVSIGNAKGAEKIVVPEIVSEKPVTKIADFGFLGETNIKSVYLPKTVTAIGESAFEGCSGLEKIKLPKSITKIGIFGFAYCTSLEEIKLPREMTIIGDGAFADCTGLKKIEIPSESISSLGGTLLSGCTSLESVTLPFVGSAKKCEEGFDYVFGGDIPKFIKHVKILGGSLKDGDFKGMKALEMVEITDEVAEAGVSKDAFYGCTSLKYNEYKGCVYLGSKDNKYVALIKAKSTDIESCKISRKTRIICRNAFEGCDKLESVKLGKNVVRIEDGAFKDCKNLQSIYIPKSVKYIEEGVFNGCIRLTIHCEAEKAPSGQDGSFSKEWNPLNRPVVWGE